MRYIQADITQMVEAVSGPREGRLQSHSRRPHSFPLTKADEHIDFADEFHGFSSRDYSIPHSLNICFT